MVVRAFRANHKKARCRPCRDAATNDGQLTVTESTDAISGDSRLAVRPRYRITVRGNCLLGDWHNAKSDRDSLARPSPQSDPWLYDHARIVSGTETAATRTRDGRSSSRRLASVGQGHPGIPGSLRFRLRCVKKWTSRSGDRKTARRSCVFRRRSSLHPEETPRKREKAPHDAYGSRDSDKGRPGMGVPMPQFERCRTGNRR
jgi:hypothetical protein